MIVLATTVRHQQPCGTSSTEQFSCTDTVGLAEAWLHSADNLALPVVLSCCYVPVLMCLACGLTL